ncbi:hypothetical protein FQA39_LY13046 [Lamprigera yunnana]|nr:hypothetical protein FQA39_LY13046 [Lamprigera yunnana]
MEQSGSSSKVASTCSYDNIENLVEDEGNSLMWPPPHVEERQELKMFKRFLDMYGNMTFTEEEVLFSNTGEEESTPGTSNEETRALKKIKIDEDIIYWDSGEEDNVDGRNKIPYFVKIKAVELADLHPKWSLAILQKRSTRLLKSKTQLSK